MKLTLAATIIAFFAIPALAFGQQGNSASKAPKPTKAEAQKVAQIISSDRAKLQAYCETKKLYDQMGAAYKKNDTKTADALNKQADALVGNRSGILKNDGRPGAGRPELQRSQGIHGDTFRAR